MIGDPPGTLGQSGTIASPHDPHISRRSVGTVSEGATGTVLYTAQETLDEREAWLNAIARDTH